MEQSVTNDSKIFLNRQKELDYIDEKIKYLSSDLANEESLSRQPKTHFVLYFYGVGRLGKSSIINQIYYKAQKVENIKLPVALIDFDNNGRYRNQNRKENIIKDIIDQWRGTIDFNLEDLITGDEKFGTKLVTYLKKIKKTVPVVLLFDTLESASPDTFKWLQEELIVPLLDEWKVLVAYAGRKKIIESQLYFPWGIKRYLRYFPLERFTEKQTKDHIRKLIKNDEEIKIPKDIMELTGGIPGLNEEMAGLIINNPKVENQNQVYLQHMVDKMIFGDKKDRLLYKNDLIYISVCRQFENRLLDYLIENLGWRKYDGEIRSSTALIQKLLETTLLENFPDGYGYVFAMNYRRIVDSYFRSVNNNDHLRIHILCFQWYEKEVDKGDWVALADQIYHLVGAWYDLKQRSDFDNELANKLPDSRNRRETLKELLSSKLEILTGNRSATIINKLKWILEGEEFSWFMPQAEIDELLKICDDFIKDFDKQLAAHR